MKFTTFGALTIAAAFIAFSVSPGQQNDAAQKHIMVAPQNAARPVEMEALSIERGLPYPSVVTLKGNVRIKTPVCLPVGPQDSLVCDGYMIVRAAGAQLDETTGEIRATGSVEITPIYHEKKK